MLETVDDQYFAHIFQRQENKLYETDRYQDRKLSLHLILYGLTALSRENNTGKSTILETLAMVLPRGFGVRRDNRFTVYGFRLNRSGYRSEKHAIVAFCALVPGQISGRSQT